MRLEKWDGMAGRVAIGLGRDAYYNAGSRVTIQTLVYRRAWQLGFECIWYDGPHMSFGIGPLLLVAWDPWTSWGYDFAEWLARRSGAL